MNIIEINKVLSHKVRLDILEWLKKPETNFPQLSYVPDFGDGVCMCHIQAKTGLSQPALSHYLNMMHKIDFLIVSRHGKWTYYKRNESKISEYVQTLARTL